MIVYEVQQSSDLTFRIYDYDRPGTDGKPRPLHVEQALDVIDFRGEARTPTPWRRLPGAEEEEAMLVESEHFRLERFCPSETRTEHAAYAGVACLSVLEGEAKVRAGGGFLPRAKRGQSDDHRQPRLLRHAPYTDRIPDLVRPSGLSNRSAGSRRDACRKERPRDIPLPGSPYCDPKRFF